MFHLCPYIVLNLKAVALQSPCATHGPFFHPEEIVCHSETPLPLRVHVPLTGRFSTPEEIMCHSETPLPLRVHVPLMCRFFTSKEIMCHSETPLPLRIHVPLMGCSPPPGGKGKRTMSGTWTLSDKRVSKWHILIYSHKTMADLTHSHSSDTPHDSAYIRITL